MALAAVRGEPSRGMIGIGGPAIVRLVAGITVCRGAGVYAPGMALGATQPRMRTGESKERVIERPVLPDRDLVAQRAVQRELSGRMVRVGCALVVIEVAGLALAGSPPIDALGVALDAGQIGVPRPLTERRVIETRPIPTIEPVTRCAVSRESRRLMVRIYRPVVVRLVTGVALRRGPGIDPIFMALSTALIPMMLTTGPYV